jgi:hypothetical protein
MAKCCIHCFNDSVLIEVASRGEVANCSFCGAVRVPTISSDTLFSSVELILYGLEVSEGGEDLTSLLYNQFGLLNPAVVKDAQRLVREIFGEEIADLKYVFKFDVSLYSSQWLSFKEELKHKNRFFPRSALISQVLNPSSSNSSFGVFLALLEQLKAPFESGELLYRARISESALTAEKMGAPPPMVASGGRANPIGIPYLYLAQNLDTCVAEVRPNNASSIYVSEFVAVRDLNLLSLTDPRCDCSVLKFEEQQMQDVLCFLDLLERFSLELSKPILPDKSHIEYIPTQYMCEFVKSVANYDGIVFNSSFGQGRNYVIFDSDTFLAKEPYRGQVVSTRHDFLADPV